MTATSVEPRHSGAVEVMDLPRPNAVGARYLWLPIAALGFLMAGAGCWLWSATAGTPSRSN
ncbi:MAG: hypothetical protein ABI625_27480, partial [bacterium]